MGRTIQLRRIQVPPLRSRSQWHQTHQQSSRPTCRRPLRISLDGVLRWCCLYFRATLGAVPTDYLRIAPGQAADPHGRWDDMAHYAATGTADSTKGFNKQGGFGARLLCILRPDEAFSHQRSEDGQSRSSLDPDRRGSPPLRPCYRQGVHRLQSVLLRVCGNQRHLFYRLKKRHYPVYPQGRS